MQIKGNRFLSKQDKIVLLNVSAGAIPFLIPLGIYFDWTLMDLFWIVPLMIYAMIPIGAGIQRVQREENIEATLLNKSQAYRWGSFSLFISINIVLVLYLTEILTYTDLSLKYIQLGMGTKVTTVIFLVMSIIILLLYSLCYAIYVRLVKYEGWDKYIH